MWGVPAGPFSPSEAVELCSLRTLFSRVTVVAFVALVAQLLSLSLDSAITARCAALLDIVHRQLYSR